MAEPVSVMDVAEFILREQGPMSTWQLQKLCYYAQAWSLVWDDEPLFEEPIEAWTNGPVVRKLYNSHRGHHVVSSARKGDPAKLDEEQRLTVEGILEMYGHYSGAILSGMTHRERPWRKTRQDAGLQPKQRGNAVITHELMKQYYSKDA